MCVTTSSDRIFMQVRCDALDHLHLFASFIKCDGMRIAGTEENLEDLKWVTIEGIAWDLALTIYKSRRKFVKLFLSKIYKTKQACSANTAASNDDYDGIVVC